MANTIEEIVEKPRTLMNHVIGLIARDISAIQAQGMIEKDGKKLVKKLPHETANDLVRYSVALLNIIRDLDEQDEKNQKTLNEMSDAELIEVTKKAIAEMEAKK